MKIHNELKLKTMNIGENRKYIYIYIVISILRLKYGSYLQST